MTGEQQSNVIVVKVSVLGAPQEGMGSAEVTLPMGASVVPDDGVALVHAAVKRATHEATRDLLHQILDALMEDSGPADAP